MPHGVHNTAQTAFRLPEGLLAWLREQAEREGDTVTMTGIVVRALERERERCAAPPAPAVFVAADSDQPAKTPRNCKHRNMKMTKGVCPDCHQPVGYKNGDSE